MSRHHRSLRWISRLVRTSVESLLVSFHDYWYYQTHQRDVDTFLYDLVDDLGSLSPVVRSLRSSISISTSTSISTSISRNVQQGDTSELRLCRIPMVSVRLRKRHLVERPNRVSTGEIRRDSVPENVVFQLPRRLPLVERSVVSLRREDRCHVEHSVHISRSSQRRPSMPAMVFRYMSGGLYSRTELVRRTV